MNGTALISSRFNYFFNLAFLMHHMFWHTEDSFSIVWRGKRKVKRIGIWLSKREIWKASSLLQIGSGSWKVPIILLMMMGMNSKQRFP
jgi:hypothetical protein